MGEKQFSLDIKHYLKTFLNKPSALKNSFVLKSDEELKYIFDLYYNDKSKRFIEIIQENKIKDIKEIKNILILKKDGKDIIAKSINSINNLTRKQISMYNKLSIGVDKNEY